mgnify:CR=1 FL=1
MPRNAKRRSSSNKKQRGGRVSFPAEYFNPNAVGRYSENNISNKNAVSYGVTGENYAGPDHEPTINQSGGGLPLEYFNPEASGNYFMEGAPELQTCTSPYGILHPVSHGVVLDAPDGGKFDPDGLSAGPNLAASSGPNMVNTNMTGGRRRRRSKRRANKNSKRRANKNSKRRANKNSKRRVNKNSKRRANKNSKRRVNKRK